MIPASLLMQEAVHYSQTMTTRVDVWRGRELIFPNAPVTDGSIDGDRTTQDRLSCSLTLALDPWDSTYVRTETCQLHVSRGFESLGTSERLSLGWFRVDQVQRGNDGNVDVDASGREAYVIDARFLRPRTPPYGVSTLGAITALIKEAVPSAVVRWRTTRDKPVQATAPWDRERWDAIEALAESIDAEVFCDYTGEFIIADKPSLVTGVPVMRIAEGEGGVLVERTEKDSREQVYNAVSVSSSSSDPNVPPVWGWAADDDPTSPTYYYADPLDGGFGQVPRFYTSQFFTTDVQCYSYAKDLLVESLAANRILSFEVPPISFLEVGDLVDVDMLDGSREVHLIQKISYPLGVDGTMSCDTLASKVEARDAD